MSEEEIAELYGIFVMDVKIFIERDVKEGRILKESAPEGLTLRLNVGYFSGPLNR